MSAKSNCFKLGFVLVIISGFMITRDGEADTPTRPTAPTEVFGLNDGMKIPDLEIQRVKTEALQGSGKAAIRLSEHYGALGLENYVASKSETNGAASQEHKPSAPEESNQGEYWLQIAAENGDAVSQYNYASLLESKPDPMAQTRAKFWYERAYKSGFTGFTSEEKKSLGFK